MARKTKLGHCFEQCLEFFSVLSAFRNLFSTAMKLWDKAEKQQEVKKQAVGLGPDATEIVTSSVAYKCSNFDISNVDKRPKPLDYSKFFEVRHFHVDHQGYKLRNRLWL